MSEIIKEKVISVHHWTDKLFSFKTTRMRSLNFKNGQFIMIGIKIKDRIVMRAYSIASANYEDELEFFSIKVDNGELTSHLKNLKIGDEIFMSSKPTGTLIEDNLLPGENLYLLSTGTGLAPFLSVIKDIDVLEKYKKIILVHGVRYEAELAYHQFLKKDIYKHEYFQEYYKEKLIYYPTITREPYINNGRITEIIKNKKLFNDINQNSFSIEKDRVMICGNPNMLLNLKSILLDIGFDEAKQGYQGHFAIEKAFAEKDL